MANTTIKIPTGTLRALGQAFVPEVSPEAENLKLSIRISDEDISIRDLAAFLDLTDRMYGRLSENGLLSYAHRERDHVQISRLRKGSWQLELIEILGSVPSFTLVLIGIILKYLPTLAEGYNNVQQGRLADQRRKQIREQLRQDEHLANIDTRKLSDISNQIDQLLEKDKDLLHRASRFAEKDLLEVEISSDGADKATD